MYLKHSNQQHDGWGVSEGPGRAEEGDLAGCTATEILLPADTFHAQITMTSEIIGSCQADAVFITDHTE